MKALTLWPEWAAAVVHLGKRIENRTWMPPASVIGTRIAIHAGVTPFGPAKLRGREVFANTAQQEGWIAAVDNGVDHEGLELVFRRGWSDGTGWTRRRLYTGAIVATARLGQPREPTDGHPWADAWPWAHPGAVHWPLSGLRVLSRPIPIKGQQGLWNVPADIEQQITDSHFTEPNRRPTP